MIKNSLPSLPVFRSRFWTQCFLLIILTSGISSCASKTIEPSGRDTSMTLMANQNIFLQGDTLSVWHSLQQYPSKQLAALSQSSDNNERAWAELALLSKKYARTNSALSQALMSWRNKYPKHPGNQLFPQDKTLTQLSSYGPPQQIAVFLPMRGSYRNHSQAIREGFLNAYYENLSKTNKQRVKFYDTSQGKDLSILYQQAIAEGADVVIGPLTKQEVEQMRQAGPFNHPTLALNYASTSGFNQTNFYEYGLLPEDETQQLVLKARAIGIKNALVIAPRTALGKRLVAAFDSKWRMSGGMLTDRLFFSNQKNLSVDIARFLQVKNATLDSEHDEAGLIKKRRTDFDAIFVFGDQPTAKLVMPLLYFNHANDVPIFANSAVYNGKQDADMKNIVICDIPARARALKSRQMLDQKNSSLYAMGQDAYLLSQNLTRLTLLPHFALYGETGAMTLSPNHQIHRRLPCFNIQNEA